MLLNRAVFLPLLLAGCAPQVDNSDQAAKIEELEQRVADLESRADTVEANQKTIARAAAVSLQRPVAAPTGLATDLAFERIKKLESAERDREVKDAEAAFKDAVAK